MTSAVRVRLPTPWWPTRTPHLVTVPDGGCAVVVSLVLSLLGASALAAEAESQLWNGVFVAGHLEPVPPNLALWFDGHARRSPGGLGGIVRPGVGYQATRAVSVWGGYAWIGTASDDTGSVTHEHRLWQQAVLDYRVPVGVALQSRTRLEQRFRADDPDVGFRARQFVRVNVQPSQRLTAGLALWDEVFLGLGATDWGQPGGLDQNRLFVGPYVQASPWVRLEAGYLQVYLDRDVDTLAHCVALNVFTTFRPKRDE